MIARRFNAWLAAQIQQGLIGIRFSVCRRPGVCASAIKAELLQAENRISAGELSRAPGPTTFMPAHIASIIQNTSI